MAATCTLRPWGAAAPRALRATAPKTTAGPSPSASFSLARRPSRLEEVRPAAALTPLQQLGGQRTGGWARRRRAPPPPQAQKPDTQQQAQPATPADSSVTLGSIGLFLLWGALVFYAFVLSPNQTPVRDGYLLEYIVKGGLGIDIGDTGFKVNSVFTYLFYVMGLYPLIYTALLYPAGRSGNGVPAWPFVTLSYAFGAFGLLPYMALWTPPTNPPALPPAKKDLEGTRNIIVRGMESPVTGYAVLAGAVWLAFQAATAGGQAWLDYLKLFDESRLVHVTSIDFLTLTVLAPFWMSNDAELRKWEGRGTLLPLLCVLPVLGPAIYLCLRPRAQ